MLYIVNNLIHNNNLLYCNICNRTRLAQTSLTRRYLEFSRRSLRLRVNQVRLYYYCVADL